MLLFGDYLVVLVINLILNMKTEKFITIGDPSEELKTIQVIVLSLSNAAQKITQFTTHSGLHITLPPLLLSASKAMSLVSINGTKTPIEIIALSTRNTFELYTRLVHLIKSEENCQAWREEAVTDQKQIYDGILTIEGPKSLKNTIQMERKRVERHAQKKGLGLNRKIPHFKKLAVEAGLESEYDAFFKLYSKFVHPSSFVVNWPEASSTPMYRSAFIFNIQQYGLLMLERLDTEFSIKAEELVLNAKNVVEGILGNINDGRKPLIH